MSWDMWHTYGYGIETNPAVIPKEKLIAFIKNHKQTIEDKDPRLSFVLNVTIAECESTDNISNEEFAEEIQACTDSGCYAEIIALVMSEETGIEFCSTGISDEGEEAVIFPRAYIWEYSDKEKQLNKDDIDNLFAEYTKELFKEETKPDFIDYVFSG